MTPALTIEALSKRYGSLAAVDGLSLQAATGAVTALLGPNGAGKTTTVEICAGLRSADSGRVSVLGRRPGDPDLRHRVAVMPQRAGVYPGARCAEMLRLVASYYATPVPPAELLDRLGLAGVARTTFRRLSGGQQQRLSLAMAVVGRPELVFLDEPSAGLDVQARHAGWGLIRELRDSGVAIILTTHAMDEAAALADHVVIIDHGRVLTAGSVAELTSSGAQSSLRFRAPPGLDLGPLAASLAPGVQPTEPAPGHYLIEAAVTPALLAAVTAWAAGHDALVAEIAIERRSLEDVFLDLTGRELRS